MKHFLKFLQTKESGYYDTHIVIRMKAQLRVDGTLLIKKMNDLINAPTSL